MNSRARKSLIRRNFRDLSQADSGDVEQSLILARLGWSGGFGWETLLQSRRVLIISEAGTGKSFECRMQQQLMWDSGEPAFYLDLASLATSQLEDLQSAEENARFCAWLSAQSDVATFFLDSIDELKLTLSSFEGALKRLARAVSGRLGRVRIVITARPVPFDQQSIRRHFPVPIPMELAASGDEFAAIAMGCKRERPLRPDQDHPHDWRNVALMPLSYAQIRQMAANEGVADADDLLADIRERNAEDFARRPQDLIEICADWLEHRRIRSHREQVVNNIQVKLKPRGDRKEAAELSGDKALEGASRLAFAALLTRKLTIRHSVEADRGGERGTSLDPEAILSDWTPKERRTLLERPLFGFATYGRVRFHHQSVVEFLAAERINGQLAQGMPIRAVKRLLFSETLQGIKVVRPTMRPVAAWLAATRSSIFAEVCDREPDVLLNHADPESLTTGQRIETLRSYVRYYGQGGWRGAHVPQLQVHRFATTDLSECVHDIWNAGVENEEVRELLLQIIGEGPLPRCADIAYHVAIDESATHGERLDAIIALERLDDARIPTITEAMVRHPTLWPDNLVRSAVVQLFPKHIGNDQFFSLLSRIPGSPSTVDALTWMLPRKIQELDLAPHILEALRAGLTKLVTEDLTWSRETSCSVGKRPHLLPALAAVCLKMIGVEKVAPEVATSAVIVLRLEHGNYSHYEPVQTLREVIGKLPTESREAIFWSDDEFSQRVHYRAEPWDRLVHACYDGPLTLNRDQDGAWIRRNLADPSRSFSDRAMMLEASMGGLWEAVGDDRAHLESLKQYVSDQPELTARIEDCLTPKKEDPKHAKLMAQIEREKSRRRKQEAQNREGWLSFWREIADDPEAAFSACRVKNTVWKLWQVMCRAGDDSFASGWNRCFVEQQFGKETADRLRRSMRPIWRNGRPTLRCERSEGERDSFKIIWQLGLAAITAEAEDPTWAENLTNEEAELAARYAPIELNGLPAWLEGLVRKHPEAVERTLGPDLSAELNEIAVKDSFTHLLRLVGYAPAAVIDLFLPRVQEWFGKYAGQLREGEDEQAVLKRLELVVEILVKHADDETRNRVKVAAIHQLQIAGDDAMRQLWLTTLMRLDPNAGADALERILQSLEPGAQDAAINLFGAIFGNYHKDSRVDLRGPRFTPALLLRLVRLAYRYIRPSDDITHEGTFSPGARDFAEQGRNMLLEAIVQASGADAWGVKLQMAADPLFAHFRDRLAFLARERAAGESDNLVFSESEVCSFDQYGEAAPKTGDGMFNLLADRLDDLDDLLLQDVSPRDAWALIHDERVMRREIARELRHNANHVYSVDQEAVTGDENETDIRLRAASSSQQAAIELKIGENSSARKLRDAIKEQLVAKYMAPENGRSGCLLVTVARDHHWRHPDSGEMLDVDGLRCMLEAEVARIVDEMGGSLRLAARVLDLRPRLNTEP